MDTIQSLLLRVGKAVVSNPAFAPRNGVTYCNYAAQLIAQAVFGYTGFDGKNANEIHAFLASSQDWIKVTASEAAMSAGGGQFAVASQTEEGHGHVAVVVPGEMIQSAHWGHPAPLIANVGKVCNIMSTNFGFANEPDFYLFKFPGVS